MVEIWWVDLRFAAARCGTVPLGAILVSTPFSSLLSTDTLQCCFSAVVCVQVITEPFDLAEELPTGMVEAASKSGACERAQFACTLVFHRFKRVLAYAGVRALILACLLLLSARR